MDNNFLLVNLRFFVMSLHALLLMYSEYIFSWSQHNFIFIIIHSDNCTVTKQKYTCYIMSSSSKRRAHCRERQTAVSYAVQIKNRASSILTTNNVSEYQNTKNDLENTKYSVILSMIHAN